MIYLSFEIRKNTSNAAQTLNDQEVLLFLVFYLINFFPKHGISLTDFTANDQQTGWQCKKNSKPHCRASVLNSNIQPSMVILLAQLFYFNLEGKSYLDCEGNLDGQ